MKEFSFSPEQSQYDIENILKERKEFITATEKAGFTDFELTADGFIANVPPCSVVKFIIER